MARPSKLTPEQWALAKRRWEGTEKPGFAWLAREIQAAWGVEVLRKSLEQWANAKGWEKGGEPLAELPKMAPPAPEKAAGNIPADAGNIPLPAGKIPAEAKPAAPPRELRHEVASEVVDPPPPAPPPPPRPALGRPSAYRPEFAERLIDFFTVEPYTEVDVPQPSGLVKRQRMATDPPMLQEFARRIGVTKETIDNWATAINPDGTPRYPEFFDAYARARELQESLFSRAGMLGVYEPRFLAMAMKNLCGWQDQPAPKVDHAAVSKDELDRRFGQRVEAARLRQMAVLEERRELRRLADEAAGEGGGLAALALPGPADDAPAGEPGAGGLPTDEPEELPE